MVKKVLQFCVVDKIIKNLIPYGSPATLLTVGSMNVMTKKYVIS